MRERRKGLSRHTAGMLALAAALVLTAVPAVAAGEKVYVPVSEKNESWNNQTGKWVAERVYKATWNKAGKKQKEYTSTWLYDGEARQNYWKTDADSYKYNANGTLKQVSHYADPSCETYTGKTVYSWKTKAGKRVLSKETVYDARGKARETTKYTVNSAGRTTKSVTKDAEGRILRKRTWSWTGSGALKKETSEFRTEDNNGYWESFSYTYRKGVLAKAVKKYSLGYTTTETWKNGLLRKEVTKADSYTLVVDYAYDEEDRMTGYTSVYTMSDGYTTRTDYTYSGYDEQGNYTEDAYTYTAGNYSSTTRKKYIYTYSKGNVKRKITQIFDEATGQYINESRETYTWKKVPAVS